MNSLLLFMSFFGVTLVLKWRNVVISTQMNQIKLIQLILSLQSSIAQLLLTDYRLLITDYDVIRMGVLEDDSVISLCYEDGGACVRAFSGIRFHFDWAFSRQH